MGIYVRYHSPYIVKYLESMTGDLFMTQYADCILQNIFLGAEYSYLSAIDALMYISNNTRPDIVFAVNYLAKYSAVPKMYHWNDIKNILRYLNDTIDLGLFFQRNQGSDLIGYVDAGYLSDP
jgi:hypothetical protein